MEPLTLEKWIAMLPSSPRPAGEQVVYISNAAECITPSKAEWQEGFGRAQGCTVKDGNELEVVACESSRLCLNVPDWALKKLRVKNGDRICVTVKGDKRLLKRYTVEEGPCEFAGSVVYDSFRPICVQRTRADGMPLQEVTFEYVESLLARMGRLRHDPVQLLHATKGRLGYLVRKHLTNSLTRDDSAFAKDFRSEMALAQKKDGSLNGNALETAFAIIGLIELDTPLNDAVITRCVEWLLSMPEPAGAPGAFNATPEITENYNRFRQEYPDGRRVSYYDRIAKDRHRRAEVLPYFDNTDLFGPPSEFCDARHLFVTGVVLQALLRAGAESEGRTKRAVRTLLSNHWCQDYYSGREPELKKVEINFNDNEFLRVAAADPRVPGYVAADSERPVHSMTGLRGNRAYLSRCFGCGCVFMISRGLSYHPAWPGSATEEYVSTYAARHANWDWSNCNAYLSFMMRNFECIDTPVSAYSVARYIPMLIRTQRADGYWDESDRVNRIGGRKKHVKFFSEDTVPAPDREVSTYLICSALKKFGFLGILRP